MEYPVRSYLLVVTILNLVCNFFLVESSVSIVQSGDAVAGRPLTLLCKVNISPGNTDYIQWARQPDGGNPVIIYSSSSCTSTVSISPTFQTELSGGCEKVNGEEVYRLTIQNVTLNVERFTWRCLSLISGVGDTLRLNVQVMVDKVSMTRPPDKVLADKPTTIVCNTSVSKPDACIRMYLQRGGRLREITTGQPTCNQDSTSVKTTTRSIEFIPTADDNGGTLYCTANNSVTDTPVRSQDYTLNVQYPPRSPLTISGYVSNTSRESGTELTLRCTVGEGNPVPTLVWSSVCAGNNGRLPVTVDLIPSLNGESCSCRGNQAGSLTGWTAEDRVIFNVTFGPDSISLTSDPGQSGDRVHVTENTTVRLTCTGGESNPPAILTWYRNNTIGQTALLNSTRGDNNGYIVSGRYTLIPDRYMDGRAVRCEARRSEQLTSRNTSIILDVKYISLENCKYSYIFVENQTASISCTSWSKPGVEFNWQRVHRSLVSQTKNLPNHRQQSTLTFTGINRSHSGVYNLTINNTAGEVRHRISITIYYAPDVYVLNGSNTEVVEGEDLILECRGQGQPNNITYTEWSHFIRGTDIPLSPRQPEQRLHIRDVRFQDQGTYRCGATNGFGGVKVNTTNVRIKAVPQYPSQNKVWYTRLGSKTSLNISFVSYPSVKKITWYIMAGNSLIPAEGNNKVSTQSPPREDYPLDFSFFKKTVQLLGQKAQLDILKVTKSDIQNYTVVIENEIGASNFTVALKTADVPCSPYLNKLVCTDNNAAFGWISCFNGGSKQTFLIQKKIDDSHWITSTEDIPDPGENTTVTHELIGLRPDHLNKFRVVAKNLAGVAYSDETDCDFTPGPPDDIPQTGTPIGAIVGPVLVVVILVVAIPLGIVLWRRNFFSKCKLGNSKTERATSGESITSQADRLYQSITPSSPNHQTAPVYANVTANPVYQNVPDSREGAPPDPTYEKLQACPTSDRKPNPVYENI